MGIPVLILERNAASMVIPRAIVLDDEGARTLQAAGIVDELLARVVEGDGPIFFDDDGKLLARVGAGTREYGFNKRFFIHQPELESLLKKRLEQSSVSALHFNAEVCGIQNRNDHVEVHVKVGDTHRVISAKVALACDGARSSVRQFLGITMQGSTYGEDWLVLDTKNDPDTSRNTKAFCRLDRPFMSVPAPDGGRRYEFKLLAGETREAMTTPEAVRQLLQPVRHIEPEDITRIAVYTFQARIADRLVDSRILLLGDAAHLTPPFAGQGMNAGLRDTANVAWKVAMVVRGEAEPSLLSTYELERRDHVRAMIQLAVVMGEIIMPNDHKQKQLHNALLSRLSDFPGMREYLLGMKFKPRPRYDVGVFAGLEAPTVPASLVGSMIPQPGFKLDGKTRRLDDVIGPRFALIAQSPTAENFALQNADMLWPELDPVLISTATATNTAPSHIIRGEFIEPDIAFPLLAHRDQLLLVRPDRYAAAAFWPEDAAAVVAAFRNALRTPLAAAKNLEERSATTHA